MRMFLLSFFLILSAMPTAFAAVSCSTEIPADGCEAGCYANAGTCTKCPNGTYSNKGSTQPTDCKNCTNIPAGATSTDAGTTSTNCPWKITCNAGTEWKNDTCTTCETNKISSSSSTITFNGMNTSGITACTACGTGKYANENHTSCLSYTYTITLDKNCSGTSCDSISNGKFYEKYDVGFSNSESGSFVAASNLTLSFTTSRFGYIFGGFYTAASGGTQVVTNTLKLTSDITPTKWTDNATVYAHWIGATLTLQYTGTNAPTTNTTCNYGNTCTVATPTSYIDGQIFTGWKCTSGCSGTPIIQPGTLDQTLLNNTTIKLEAQWAVCNTGYYCKDNEKKTCPAGSTTDGEGKSAQTECFISGATKFIDNNNKSFSLPIAEINYQ